MKIYDKFYSHNKSELRVLKYIKQLKKLAVKELLVCCFYKPDDDLAQSHQLNDNEILMWAHYAGWHSGICMEFSDIVPQDNELQSKLKHRQIAYKNDDTKTLKFSIGLAASNNPNKLAFLPQRLILKDLQKIYDDKYDSIYHTKKMFWQYERERRYSILKDDLPNQQLKYDFRCLQSITFGVNTPQDERDKIKAIIDEKCKEFKHRVNFYEVKIENGAFKIDECKS